MPKPAVKPTVESAAFWEACNRQQLLFQVCEDCSEPQFYPQGHCVHCHGDRLSWKASAGRGRIEALTVVHRAGNKAFDGDVPFSIAIVRMDEGYNMMMNVVGPGRFDAAIWGRISVSFEADEYGQRLPQAVLQV